MSKKIYLAGPINGCTDDEADSWRNIAKARLGAANCIDPMRRDYRGREESHLLEIVDGDKKDIASCDVMLANCWQPSTGTAMEIHLAWILHIPVLAVVQPRGPVSPWLRYHAMIYRSLDSALIVIPSIGG